MRKRSRAGGYGRAAILLVFGLGLVALRAEEPTVAVDAPTPTFLTAATVAEVGVTRMIPFRLAAPAATDLRLPVSGADGAVLEVVRAPEVLAGYDTGFLRVRGIGAGRTRLHLGGATLEVEVVPPRAPADPEALRPRIVNPASGAAVWGTFAVGVELGPEAPSDADIELQIPGSTPPAATRRSHPARGPGRRVVFTLDAASLPPGRCEFTAVTVLADGSRIGGEPAKIRILHPRPDQVIGFEAEDPGPVERPERFGRERPMVYVHPEASGAECALNAGPRPAVCLPVPAPSAGKYQVMVRALGTFAGGALPTISVYVDQADQPVTNGVLVDETWHRIAVGVPIRLAAGDHVVTPYFANDYSAGPTADRNLFLDRIELARVEDEGVLDGVARIGGGGEAMGDMAMTGGSMAMDEAGADRPAPLRIGIETPLHDRIATGAFEVRGLCFWLEPGKNPAPRVSLLVNGRELGAQRSAAPRFVVPADALQTGPNEILLSAVAVDGGRAASPAVRVLRPGAADEPAGDGSTAEPATEAASPPGAAVDPAGAFWRFTAHDESWDAEAKKRIGNHKDPPERRSIGLFSNGRVALDLPESLAGRYQASLEARGDVFEGAPVAQVTFEGNGHPLTSVEVEVGDGWRTVDLAPVDLPAGPKRVVIAFANDRFVKGSGDRNLYIQAVSFERASPADDETPPEVRLLYPPDGHPVHLTDAVVAEACDDRALAAGELMLDGARTGLRVDAALSCGRLVFPLLLRSLSPGRHTVSVRVTDEAGRARVSAERAIEVRAEAPPAPGPYRRAIRLLNRFAYGPDPQELATILVAGERTWLEERLSRPLSDPGESAALGFAEASRAQDSGLRTAGERLLEHALRTQNPARARAVQWIENHFSTWIQKNTDGMEWIEHRTFLRLGAAPFPDLLFASARSPAMLRYLDQQASVVRRLNENYAREIMELHSVGVHGGYRQEDVTTLAHLLTGWTFAEEGDGWAPGPLRRRTYRFDPQVHDARPFRWFGMSFAAVGPEGRYDRPVAAIEMLAAHPSTARFLARRLAEHYGSVPAPEDLVEDLARVFLEQGGDLKAMILALAAHPRFWEPSAPERLCTPFDFAVRLARATGFLRPGPIQDFLQRSAMAPFGRPTPDGYPEEDSAWSDSNALLQRWRLARRAEWELLRLVPGRWRRGEDPPDAAWRQGVIDLVAIRLLGVPLGDESNRSALELLAAAKGGRPEQARLAAVFVAQLPEANLR